MNEPQAWTIQKLVIWTTEHFAGKKISSARVDAEVLLAHVLKCKRLDLYLKFDQPMQEPELKIFKSLVIRRAQREPVAYITGHREFYGREFAVGPGVLIPRPETEHLVDEALSWIKNQNKDAPWNILDVGSGSGCISVTLASEIPNAQVTALDKSEAGCRFTKMNAEALGALERVDVQQKDFEQFESAKSYDIIVTNPPYIGLREKQDLQIDVAQFEPAEALFGGPEGHETMRVWIPKIKNLLKPGGLLLCEIGFQQGAWARDFLSKQIKFTDVQVIKDYAAHDRLVKATKPQEAICG